MSRAHSFLPVAGRGASVLILGSMPGRASLAAGQYYAHPRNLFWRIMTEICGGAAALSYPGRLRLLKANGIALWDVLDSCVRPGSADSAIERATMRANDLVSFFRTHPGIRTVLFNGAKAEDCYRRCVLPALPAACAGLNYRRLPSTSPAHASVPYAGKLSAWKTAVGACRNK